MKYRKKPIVIEAFQMTPEAMGSGASWPEWLRIAHSDGPGEGGFWKSDDGKLCLGTLKGVYVVTEGDWIVRGSKGQLFSRSPMSFEATYEEDHRPSEVEELEVRV